LAEEDDDLGSAKLCHALRFRTSAVHAVPRTNRPAAKDGEQTVLKSLPNAFAKTSLDELIRTTGGRN
jgi:hypothetical protein